MRSFLFPLCCAAVLAAGCSKPPAAAPATAKPAAPAVKTEDRRHDESSYADPGQVVITDLALDLKLDFDSKTLAGTATYTLDWKDPKAAELALDTRDLKIEKVEGEGTQGAWMPLQYALAPADKVLGSKLAIQAPAHPQQVA
jgi:aminopeptidase N